jgi:hypothetical protein
VAEDDDGNVNGAEHGKLMRLLEQAAFALKKGHAAVAIVANCSSRVSLMFLLMLAEADSSQRDSACRRRGLGLGRGMCPTYSA